MDDIEKDGVLIVDKGREKIYCYKDTFKNSEYIHIRTWYLDDNSNAMKPTKKGISFTPDKLDDVIKALSSL